MAGNYQEVQVVGSAVGEYLRLLATTRGEPNTLLRRFRWTGNRDGWFRTSALVYADESFSRLLGSEAARQGMPAVLEPPPFSTSSPPRFAQVPGGALGLDGDLPKLLVLGGACRRFNGAQRLAKAAAREAVFDLLEDRFEDFEMYFSDESWSRWFSDVFWDQTWILVDHRDAEVTVICTTDTD